MGRGVLYARGICSAKYDFWAVLVCSWAWFCLLSIVLQVTTSALDWHDKAQFTVSDRSIWGSCVWQRGVEKTHWRAFKSNYNGNGNANENVSKQSVLISKTMPCTCVLHFGTFLCRCLQNNNVKWPNSKFCGDREHTLANSPFSIWTWPSSLQIQLLDISATFYKLN